MNVLVVEDDNLLRTGMHEALIRSGWQCDAVASVEQAKLWMKTGLYALLLLDLGLPDGDGLSLLKYWRTQQISLPVIIITARDEVEQRIAGLDAGADDYLVKPFAIEELLARMRSVLRRSEGQSSNELTLGTLTINLQQKSAWLQQQDLVLVGKEFNLLLRLALRADQTVSREQLMHDFYSLSEPIGSNTLEVYIHKLRQKLPAHAIETIRGQGYRLRSSCLTSI